MFHRTISVAIAIISLFGHIGVRADELARPMFSLSGFGTIGLTHSDESQADFTSNFLKASGAGFTRSWSGDVDSRIGAQVTANFNPRWSAVLQVISEQRYDNSYRPIVEWANLKYQITPDLNIRVGRIALPNFLAADYRKVGYALPWARTPGEVYNLVPITNSDGVDFSYRIHSGDWKNTFQGAYGKTDIKYSDDNPARVRSILGFSNTIEYGAASARLSYVQGDLTIDLAQPLFDGFRQFGPQGNAIADRYDGHDKRISFVGLGASYDPGDWFVSAELGKNTTHSFLGDKTAGYVSGGFRFDKFTSYVMLARGRADSKSSDPGLNLTGLPPEPAAVATELNAGLNNLLGVIGVQKSIAVGARWDFMENAAFKLQYEHIKLGAGSPGNLILEQPGFRRGGSVNVFSAVLDFVF